jgi:hypothetical protein
MDEGCSPHEPLAARVAELERRVASIEAHGRPPAETSVAHGAEPRVPDRERFWALAGLQERAGAGSAVLFTGSVSFSDDRAYVWQQGVNAEQLLEADWDLTAEVLAALGHRIRLKLIQAILNGASTTAEISTLEGLGTTGQLYHHLRQLVAAGWLNSTGRGRYEVPAARVIPLLVAITAAGRWSPRTATQSTRSSEKR